MTFDELKEKALLLPLLPGVYIMKDAQGTIIYIGKADVYKRQHLSARYMRQMGKNVPKGQAKRGKRAHRNGG